MKEILLALFFAVCTFAIILWFGPIKKWYWWIIAIAFSIFSGIMLLEDANEDSKTEMRDTKRGH